QRGGTVAEGGAVPARDRPPGGGPRVEPGELGGQHHGLQGVQAAAEADPFVVVPGMPAAAVIAQAPEPPREVAVRGDHGPGVTERAEVAGRAEAEAPGLPDG